MKRVHSPDPPSPVRNVGIPATSTQSDTRSITKITDLIDDCLFEIYKKLELNDLASVADVCQRLRSTSKKFFTRTEYRWLEYPSDIFSFEKIIAADFNYNELLLKTARVLRNFGAFITDFNELFNSSIYLLDREEIGNISSLHEFAMKIMKLLTLYCSESLTELKLECLGFRNEFSEIQGLLFPNVQRLYWRPLQLRSTENVLLSLWLPNLREIRIRNYHAVHSDNISYRFDKLTSASLTEGFKRKSIVKFLSLNPQLRELNINGDSEFINFRILKSIAKYSPGLNVLRLCFVDKRKIVEYPDPSTQNYFNELKNLKFFSVTETECKYSKVLDIVRSIALAEVPLESLIVEAIYTAVNDSLIVSSSNINTSRNTGRTLILITSNRTPIIGSKKRVIHMLCSLVLFYLPIKGTKRRRVAEAGIARTKN